jgi:uncharacterized cupin superfamily protein
MSTKPVKFDKDNVELLPSPITPAWIIDGAPVARNRVLSTSEDQTACTIVWDCTKGKFNWYYDFDETVHITEGSVKLEDGHGPARTVGPGDVVFFPAGSHAVWTVDNYVRKVAFCRKILPSPIGFLVRALRAVKRRLSPQSGNAGSLMGAN